MTNMSQKILDNVLELSKDYEAITALYIIDLDTMKIKHKILSERHNKENFIGHIQKMALTLKDDSFEMLLVDLDERIVCRKVDETHIIILVMDKDVVLGKIFTLIRGIGYQEKE